MQSIDSQLPHTLVGQIIGALFLLLTGSGIGAAVVNWLVTRRKARAEVGGISAQTVKAQAEARQVDTETVIRASERIEELLDLNDALRTELIEANRRFDNVDFELRQARFDMAQMETRARLQAHLMEQLQAANKLGVELKDLPPAHRPQLEEGSSES